MSGVPALTAAVLVLWATGHAQAPAWPAGPIALVVAVLAMRRLRVDGRHLAWDGQGWQLDGQACRMSVMIDLGPWLLLRLQPAAHLRVVWLPVASVEPRAAWHGLRAALYCRVSTAPTSTAPSSPSPQSD